MLDKRSTSRYNRLLFSLRLIICGTVLVLVSVDLGSIVIGLGTLGITVSVFLLNGRGSCNNQFAIKFFTTFKPSIIFTFLIISNSNKNTEQNDKIVASIGRELKFKVDFDLVKNSLSSTWDRTVYWTLHSLARIIQTEINFCTKNNLQIFKCCTIF